MKKIFLTTIILILTSCASQQIVSKSDLTKTEEINNINKTKNQLYIIANDWLIDSFNNAQSVIQFSDKEAGKLIGKYYMHGSIFYIYGAAKDTRVFAKIDITLKDNYAKIKISPATDVVISGKTLIPKLRKQILNLTNSFKKRMTKQQ